MKANISKRPDGRFVLRGRVKDPQGRVREITRSVNGVADPVALVDAINQRIAQSMPALPTVSDVLNTYASRPGGLGASETLYVRILGEQFGPVEAHKLTARVVDEALTKPELQHKKPASVRRKLNVLQAALNYGVKMGLLNSEVRLIKPSPGQGREKWLTKQQRDEFISHCDPVLRPAAIFLFYTGARLGEALGLSWNDVVADGAGGYTATFVTRKGKGSRVRKRRVPLHPLVVEAISPQSPRSKDWVLAYPDGRPFSRSHFRRLWASACDKMLLDDFVPHDARHTCLSLMMQSGIDARIVAEIAGHNTMQMVMRYTHLNASHLTGAIGAL